MFSLSDVIRKKTCEVVGGKLTERKINNNNACKTVIFGVLYELCSTNSRLLSG